MEKLVIIKISNGDWESGFSVTLQMFEGGSWKYQETGFLPGAPDIPRYYQEWQSAYCDLPSPLRLEGKDDQQVKNSSDRINECYNAANTFSRTFNKWLNSPKFHLLKEKLLVTLNKEDRIRAIFQTESLELRRLPWHLWDFFDTYENAEVAIGNPNFKSPTKLNGYAAKNIVKILAILGDSKGIDVEADRNFLESLPNAEVVFKVEPNRKDISKELWEQNWDILFFAGHSCTKGEEGLIYINENQSLTLRELRNGLKTAIKKSLKLAIFNSCDGLGLARQLEDLYIPQAIVMREPVPDAVAQ
ncbi:MAG: CHAT domain-containing protein [Okeania sp. SIO2H7]|nr:CHAT domain-containing protein [Okeania sp. SIO2H7]